MNVLWLQKAARDLDAICDYIAEYNSQAAWDIYKTIRERVKALATQPNIGRPGRVHGTRELVITDTPYIIAYTVRQLLDAVIVLRVLHGAQLWPAGFDMEK